ncbi:MAG: hypothetical protein IPM71_03270 [Bacteroidota bacterium]|nr:MAG: hypothetical protein IPM71_03270 [Bacteroidota bacterium]
MATHKESIDKLVIKLSVLGNRIKKLEEITDEILHEVDIEYKNQIKALNIKRDAANNQLLKLKKSFDIKNGTIKQQ